MSLRFRLAGVGNPDFLDLPWELPLAEWNHERLVRMAHGVSRHVVRFVDYGGRVYALKETQQPMAEREYRLLRRLAEDDLPVVDAVGVVTGRTGVDGEALGAVLITRYLDFAVPFRYVFGARGGPSIEDALVDALVGLLVRLHLGGFFWGDCSLSNTLFRRDAGALASYLVDAETGELHSSLSDGQRDHDLEIASVNVGGELLDLEASGRLPTYVDPASAASAVRKRYARLWFELTSEQVLGEGRRELDQRLRRLNDLGFDVEEFELVAEDTGAGGRLRVRPQVVEEGHHRHRLERLTGMSVQENQARRLLNDLATYRVALEREDGQPVPEAVAAYRWLREVFEPAVAAVPRALRGKLEPPELFHELLEHRWYLSEAAGAEVPMADVVESYVTSILPEVPDQQRLLLGGDDAAD